MVQDAQDIGTKDKGYHQVFAVPSSDHLTPEVYNSVNGSSLNPHLIIFVHSLLCPRRSRARKVRHG